MLKENYDEGSNYNEVRERREGGGGDKTTQRLFIVRPLARNNRSEHVIKQFRFSPIR